MHTPQVLRAEPVDGAPAATLKKRFADRLRVRPHARVGWVGGCGRAREQSRACTMNAAHAQPQDGTGSRHRHTSGAQITRWVGHEPSAAGPYP